MRAALAFHHLGSTSELSISFAWTGYVILSFVQGIHFARAML